MVVPVFVMKKTSIILMLLLTGFVVAAQPSFKEQQKQYQRVRQAYADKGKTVEKTLTDKGIKENTLQLYLRAFKQEKELQLWAKNIADDRYTLIKTYTFCSLSGTPGPKRKQGDRQVPEGFYRIDRFNPYSNFYLSLGVSYPNKSDRILSNKSKPGGDIFIHGDCVTIGCIPITNDKIKELYVYCVEAKNNNTSIPVTIFPAKLTDSKLQELKNKYKGDTDKLNLWDDLKKAYDYFEQNKSLPQVTFLSTGRHEVR